VVCRAIGSTGVYGRDDRCTAKVAGVERNRCRISAEVSEFDSSDDATCCYMLGVTEVYRIGGMQAVAAMALGTKTVRKVDKIVGPGHPVVQMAKKMLFCEVGIDSSPVRVKSSFSLMTSANPRFVASDLIGQAEHDPGSGSS
jgi:histidinol dehydrogenase